MLDKIIVPRLVALLSEYAYIQPDQVKLSIFSGKGSLEELELKPSALAAFDLPFTVVRAVVRRIGFNVSWTALRSQPVSVTVDDVLLVVRPNSDTATDAAAQREQIRRAKERLIEAYEARRRDALAQRRGDKDDKEEEAEDGGGFATRLFEMILNNVIVDVRSVHLRYECPHPATSLPPTVLGVTLAGVRLHTTNQQRQQHFVDPTQAKVIFKLLSIDGLRLYVETPFQATATGAPQAPRLIGALETKTQAGKATWLEEMRRQFGSAPEAMRSTVYGPVSGSAFLQLVSKKHILAYRDKPRVHVAVELHNLVAQWTRAQYLTLVRASVEITTAIDAMPKPADEPARPELWAEYEQLFAKTLYHEATPAEVAQLEQLASQIRGPSIIECRKAVYKTVAKELAARRKVAEEKAAAAKAVAAPVAAPSPAKKGWFGGFFSDDKKKKTAAPQEDEGVRVLAELEKEYGIASGSEDALPDLADLPAHYEWVKVDVSVPLFAVRMDLPSASASASAVAFVAPASIELTGIRASFVQINSPGSIRIESECGRLTMSNPTVSRDVLPLLVAPRDAVLGAGAATSTQPLLSLQAALKPLPPAERTAQGATTLDVDVDVKILPLFVVADPRLLMGLADFFEVGDAAAGLRRSATANAVADTVGQATRQAAAAMRTAATASVAEVLYRHEEAKNKVVRVHFSAAAPTLLLPASVAHLVDATPILCLALGQLLLTVDPPTDAEKQRRVGQITAAIAAGPTAVAQLGEGMAYNHHQAKLSGCAVALATWGARRQFLDAVHNAGAVGAADAPASSGPGCFFVVPPIEVVADVLLRLSPVLDTLPPVALRAASNRIRVRLSRHQLYILQRRLVHEWLPPAAAAADATRALRSTEAPVAGLPRAASVDDEEEPLTPVPSQAPQATPQASTAKCDSFTFSFSSPAGVALELHDDVRPAAPGNDATTDATARLAFAIAPINVNGSSGALSQGTAIHVDLPSVVMRDVKYETDVLKRTSIDVQIRMVSQDVLAAQREAKRRAYIASIGGESHFTGIVPVEKMDVEGMRVAVAFKDPVEVIVGTYLLDGLETVMDLVNIATLIGASDAGADAAATAGGSVAGFTPGSPSQRQQLQRQQQGTYRWRRRTSQPPQQLLGMLILVTIPKISAALCDRPAGFIADRNFVTAFIEDFSLELQMRGGIELVEAVCVAVPSAPGSPTEALAAATVTSTNGAALPLHHVQRRGREWGSKVIRGACHDIVLQFQPECRTGLPAYDIIDTAPQGRMVTSLGALGVVRPKSTRSGADDGTAPLLTFDVSMKPAPKPTPLLDAEEFMDFPWISKFEAAHGAPGGGAPSAMPSLSLTESPDAAALLVNLERAVAARRLRSRTAPSSVDPKQIHGVITVPSDVGPEVLEQLLDEIDAALDAAAGTAGADVLEADHPKDGAPPVVFDMMVAATLQPAVVVYDTCTVLQLMGYFTTGFLSRLSALADRLPYDGTGVQRRSAAVAAAAERMEQRRIEEGPPSPIESPMASAAGGVGGTGRRPAKPLPTSVVGLNVAIHNPALRLPWLANGAGGYVEASVEVVRISSAIVLPGSGAAQPAFRGTGALRTVEGDTLLLATHSSAQLFALEQLVASPRGSPVPAVPPILFDGKKRTTVPPARAAHMASDGEGPRSLICIDLAQMSLFITPTGGAPIPLLQPSCVRLGIAGALAADVRPKVIVDVPRLGLTVGVGRELEMLLLALSYNVLRFPASDAAASSPTAGTAEKPVAVYRTPSDLPAYVQVQLNEIGLELFEPGAAGDQSRGSASFSLALRSLIVQMPPGETGLPLRLGIDAITIHDVRATPVTLLNARNFQLSMGGGEVEEALDAWSVPFGPTKIPADAPLVRHPHSAIEIGLALDAFTGSDRWLALYDALLAPSNMKALAPLTGGNKPPPDPTATPGTMSLVVRIPHFVVPLLEPTGAQLFSIDLAQLHVEFNTRIVGGFDAALHFGALTVRDVQRDFVMLSSFAGAPGATATGSAPSLALELTQRRRGHVFPGTEEPLAADHLRIGLALERIGYVLYMPALLALTNYASDPQGTVMALAKLGSDPTERLVAAGLMPAPAPDAVATATPSVNDTEPRGGMSFIIQWASPVIALPPDLPAARALFPLAPAQVRLPTFMLNLGSVRATITMIPVAGAEGSEIIVEASATEASMPKLLRRADITVTVAMRPARAMAVEVALGDDTTAVLSAEALEALAACLYRNLAFTERPAALEAPDVYHVDPVLADDDDDNDSRVQPLRRRPRPAAKRAIAYGAPAAGATAPATSEPATPAPPMEFLFSAPSLRLECLRRSLDSEAPEPPFESGAPAPNTLSVVSALPSDAGSTTTGLAMAKFIRRARQIGASAALAHVQSDRLFAVLVLHRLEFQMSGSGKSLRLGAMRAVGVEHYTEEIPVATLAASTIHKERAAHVAVEDLTRSAHLTVTPTPTPTPTPSTVANSGAVGESPARRGVVRSVRVGPRRVETTFLWCGSEVREEDEEDFASSVVVRDAVQFKQDALNNVTSIVVADTRLILFADVVKNLLAMGTAFTAAAALAAPPSSSSAAGPAATEPASAAPAAPAPATPATLRFTLHETSVSLVSNASAASAAEQQGAVQLRREGLARHPTRLAARPPLVTLSIERAQVVQDTFADGRSHMTVRVGHLSAADHSHPNSQFPLLLSTRAGASAGGTPTTPTPPAATATAAHAGGGDDGDATLAGTTTDFIVLEHAVLIGEAERARRIAAAPNTPFFAEEVSLRTSATRLVYNPAIVSAIAQTTVSVLEALKPPKRLAKRAAAASPEASSDDEAEDETTVRQRAMAASLCRTRIRADIRRVDILCVLDLSRTTCIRITPGTLSVDTQLVPVPIPTATSATSSTASPASVVSPSSAVGSGVPDVLYTERLSVRLSGTDIVVHDRSIVDTQEHLSASITRRLDTPLSFTVAAAHVVATPKTQITSKVGALRFNVDAAQLDYILQLAGQPLLLAPTVDVSEQLDRKRSRSAAVAASGAGDAPLPSVIAAREEQPQPTLTADSSEDMTDEEEESSSSTETEADQAGVEKQQRQQQQEQEQPTVGAQGWRKARAAIARSRSNSQGSAAQLAQRKLQAAAARARKKREAADAVAVRVEVAEFAITLVDDWYAAVTNVAFEQRSTKMSSSIKLSVGGAFVSHQHRPVLTTSAPLSVETSSMSQYAAEHPDLFVQPGSGMLESLIDVKCSGLQLFVRPGVLFSAFADLVEPARVLFLRVPRHMPRIMFDRDVVLTLTDDVTLDEEHYMHASTGHGFVHFTLDLNGHTLMLAPRCWRERLPPAASMLLLIEPYCTVTIRNGLFAAPARFALQSWAALGFQSRIIIANDCHVAHLRWEPPVRSQLLSQATESYQRRVARRIRKISKRAAASGAQGETGSRRSAPRELLVAPIDTALHNMRVEFDVAVYVCVDVAPKGRRPTAGGAAAAAAAPSTAPQKPPQNAAEQAERSAAAASTALLGVVVTGVASYSVTTPLTEKQPSKRVVQANVTRIATVSRGAAASTQVASPTLVAPAPPAIGTAASESASAGAPHGLLIRETSLQLIASGTDAVRAEVFLPRLEVATQLGDALQIVNVLSAVAGEHRAASDIAPLAEVVASNVGLLNIAVDDAARPSASPGQRLPPTTSLIGGKHIELPALSGPPPVPTGRVLRQMGGGASGAKPPQLYTTQALRELEMSAAIASEGWVDCEDGGDAGPRRAAGRHGGRARANADAAAMRGGNVQTAVSFTADFKVPSIDLVVIGFGGSNYAQVKLSDLTVTTTSEPSSVEAATQLAVWVFNPGPAAWEPLVEGVGVEASDRVSHGVRTAVLLLRQPAINVSPALVSIVTVLTQQSAHDQRQAARIQAAALAPQRRITLARVQRRVNVQRLMQQHRRQAAMATAQATELPSAVLDASLGLGVSPQMSFMAPTEASEALEYSSEESHSDIEATEGWNPRGYAEDSAARSGDAASASGSTSIRVDDKDLDIYVGNFSHLAVQVLGTRVAGSGGKATCRLPSHATTFIQVALYLPDGADRDPAVVEALRNCTTLAGRNLYPSFAWGPDAAGAPLGVATVPLDRPSLFWITGNIICSFNPDAPQAVDAPQYTPRRRLRLLPIHNSIVRLPTAAGARRPEGHPELAELVTQAPMPSSLLVSVRSYLPDVTLLVHGSGLGVLPPGEEMYIDSATSLTSTCFVTQPVQHSGAKDTKFGISDFGSSHAPLTLRRLLDGLNVRFTCWSLDRASGCHMRVVGRNIGMTLGLPHMEISIHGAFSVHNDTPRPIRLVWKNSPLLPVQIGAERSTEVTLVSRPSATRVQLMYADEDRAYSSDGNGIDVAPAVPTEASDGAGATTSTGVTMSGAAASTTAAASVGKHTVRAALWSYNEATRKAEVELALRIGITPGETAMRIFAPFALLNHTPVPLSFACADDRDAERRSWSLLHPRMSVAACVDPAPGTARLLGDSTANRDDRHAGAELATHVSFHSMRTAAPVPLHALNSVGRFELIDSATGESMHFTFFTEFTSDRRTTRRVTIAPRWVFVNRLPVPIRIGQDLGNVTLGATWKPVNAFELKPNAATASYLWTRPPSDEVGFRAAITRATVPPPGSNTLRRQWQEVGPSIASVNVTDVGTWPIGLRYDNSSERADAAADDDSLITAEAEVVEKGQYVFVTIRPPAVPPFLLINRTSVPVTIEDPRIVGSRVEVPPCAVREVKTLPPLGQSQSEAEANVAAAAKKRTTASGSAAAAAAAVVDAEAAKKRWMLMIQVLEQAALLDVFDADEQKLAADTSSATRTAMEDRAAYNGASLLLDTESVLVQVGTLTGTYGLFTRGPCGQRILTIVPVPRHVVQDPRSRIAPEVAAAGPDADLRGLPPLQRPLRGRELLVQTPPPTAVHYTATVDIIRVSVSQVATEVLNLTATNVTAQLSRTGMEERLVAGIQNFQLDNVCEINPPYPVMLMPLRDRPEDFALKLQIRRELTRAPHFYLIKSLDLDVKPLILQVSDLILVWLLVLFDSFTSSASGRSETTGATRHSRVAQSPCPSEVGLYRMAPGAAAAAKAEEARKRTAAAAARQSKAGGAAANVGTATEVDDSSADFPLGYATVVIEEMVINPIRMRVWLARQREHDIVRQLGQGEILSLLALNLRDVNIVADGQVVRNRQERVRETAQHLKALYLDRIQTQIAGLVFHYVSSIPLIGAPVRFAQTVGRGLSRFIVDPIDIDSPEERAMAIVKGSAGVLGGILGGGLGVVADITETGSRVANLAAGDNADDGHRSHVPGIARGLLRGVTGLVTKPMQGFAEKGAAGLVKGIGQGVVGVVANPVAGALSDVARISGTIAERVTDRALPPMRRHRRPRAFGPTGGLVIQNSVIEIFEYQRRNTLWSSELLLTDGAPWRDAMSRDTNKRELEKEMRADVNKLVAGARDRAQALQDARAATGQQRVSARFGGGGGVRPSQSRESLSSTGGAVVPLGPEGVPARAAAALWQLDRFHSNLSGWLYGLNNQSDFASGASERLKMRRRRWVLVLSDPDIGTLATSLVPVAPSCSIVGDGSAAHLDALVERQADEAVTLAMDYVSEHTRLGVSFDDIFRELQRNIFAPCGVGDDVVRRFIAWMRERESRVRLLWPPPPQSSCWVVELLEHERFYPVIGWSKKLMPTDRPNKPWTTRSGVQADKETFAITALPRAEGCAADPQWRWLTDWYSTTRVVEVGRDKPNGEPWEYGFDHAVNGEYLLENKMVTARRAVWRRVLVRCESAEVVRMTAENPTLCVALGGQRPTVLK